MKAILLTLLLGCSIASVHAHDFTVTNQTGQKLFFNIINAPKAEVEITYEGSITSDRPSSYSGEIEIPSGIKHNKRVYRVTAIGRKAFSNATGLKGIVLPAGLRVIGDFAFEGCTQLEKVVFPGNSVRMGEGIFFRCTSVSRVTLGSDWTSVNLKMFRWSERLTSLLIPAKLGQLQNMKSLKKLQTIEVDRNNPKFTTVDGILYSKDTVTLLGCPRGREGSVRIPEGVETIRWGGLIDCPYITAIDLPASLKTFSYREFSRMKNLNRIVMRNEQPPMTADNGKEKVFLLMAGNEKTELIVPKTAQNTYHKEICSASGEYSEISSNTPEGVSPAYALVPMEVKQESILGKDRITGVKNFSKYE